ncbi:HupE/UreJ family protein [Ruegeria sp. 6PALISEP08]|uniref:HupE/UreJ family protein n=1 Tax=Ruegeria sp. 6PALISEP08 TaxID=1225660 RepID=UPI00067E99E5|nr:HupE/UreJ family protein [Ruegeria sp. 6PALISEP08]
MTSHRLIRLVGLLLTRLAFAFLLVLFAQSALAHKFELGDAQLSIEGDSYQIAVSADLIEAFERHLDLNGSDRFLVEQVRGLDLGTIETTLSEIRAAVAEETLIRFDGKTAELRAMSFPSPRDIRAVLDRPPGSTEYRLVFVGYGDAPQGASAVSIKMSPLLGDMRLEVSVPSVTLLQAGRTSQALNLIGTQETTLSSALADFLYFTWQGVIHIVPYGLDHILFVLCLFLFAHTVRDLIWQVTAFTVAHSVTLTLGWLGFVDLPTGFFEPLIALSIVYAAVENILRNKPGGARFTLIFFFGLLHGFGFASVLEEISPSGGHWLTRLIGFNVGVEIGQLVVIAAAFLAVGLWRKEPWYRSLIVVPASFVIALVGAFWTVERALAALT